MVPGWGTLESAFSSVTSEKVQNTHLRARLPLHLLFSSLLALALIGQTLTMSLVLHHQLTTTTIMMINEHRRRAHTAPSGRFWRLPLAGDEAESREENPAAQLPSWGRRDMDSEGALPLWDFVGGADPDPGLRMQLNVL